MITPSFSLTATERVLPKLALDFTTASLDPRITFSRTTSATNPATYVNSSGHVTSATNDQPRFDYDPVTLICKGLLVEESKTNLLNYSSDFRSSTGAWINQNCTVNASATTSPSNSNDGQSVIEATGSVMPQVYRGGITKTANANHAYSCFVKANGRNNVILSSYSGFQQYIAAVFNLSGAGSVTKTQAGATSGTIVSTSITAYPNGWYRIVLVGSTAPTTMNWTISLTTSSTSNIDANGNPPTYTGNGTSGIYMWGAQLEAGAFATSYIPTTTTALTRNADVATMTGTNFSDWWTVGIGATNVSATQKSIGTISPLVQFDDNTINNIISLRGNVSNPELYIKTTTDQAQIDAGTIVANTAYNLVGTWGTNNCAASQNGAAVVTDTSATIPTVTQARIGSDGTNFANAWLQKINYWPQRITNNETQAFSK